MARRADSGLRFRQQRLPPGLMALMTDKAPAVPEREVNDLFLHLRLDLAVTGEAEGPLVLGEEMGVARGMRLMA